LAHFPLESFGNTESLKASRKVEVPQGEKRKLMLSIRMARTGKKHQAYFRIVVSESRKQPTAKFVEILGNYDPHAKKFQINKERVAYYLKNGAQPSDSVAKLLMREKIELPKWVKVTSKNKAPKKAVEEKPAAAPAAEEPASPDASQGGKPAEEAVSAEETTEAPAEELATEVTEEVAPAEEKAEEAPVKDSKPAESTEAEETKEEAK
jgi:small subunit ribosomal protein S16